MQEFFRRFDFAQYFFFYQVNNDDRIDWHHSRFVAFFERIVILFNVVDDFMSGSVCPGGRNRKTIDLPFGFCPRSAPQVPHCAAKEITISGLPLYSSIFPVTVTGLPAKDSRNFSPPTAPTCSAGTNLVKNFLREAPDGLVQSGRHRRTEKRIPRVVIDVIEAPAIIADGEIVGSLVLLFKVDDAESRYPLLLGSTFFHTSEARKPDQAVKIAGQLDSLVSRARQ